MGNDMEIMEETIVEWWKYFGNTEERQEEYWNDMKVWKKIVKWYGKYGRKPSCIVIKRGKIQKKIVKWYGKYGRNPSWIGKWFGEYRRKLWNDSEHMEEK